MQKNKNHEIYHEKTKKGLFGFIFPAISHHFASLVPICASTSLPFYSTAAKRTS
jgi:hypothetical protein